MCTPLILLLIVEQLDLSYYIEDTPHIHSYVLVSRSVPHVSLSHVLIIATIESKFAFGKRHTDVVLLAVSKFNISPKKNVGYIHFTCANLTLMICRNLWNLGTDKLYLFARRLIKIYIKGYAVGMVVCKCICFCSVMGVC